MEDILADGQEWMAWSKANEERQHNDEGEPSNR
jgi:hypothetical protein